MRPAPSTVEVTSTLSGGRSGKLRIHQDSLPNIMDTLTNIYSDAELAVIREYPSNAWDSHKRAGQTRPIEVSLPNELNSVFVVRDFGTGLDVDEIYDVYGLYALSTKRDSDDELGMLGIGAKSALAYTDQFTLRCVKDGVRVTAIISAAAGEGGGDIWTSDPVETDEDDGVEFAVAVHYPESFNRKAHEFFRFSEKGSVLVDGVEPDPLKGLWIDDDVVVLDGSEYFNHRLFQGSVIVQGGVPYPLNSSHYYDDGAPRVVAFVPIGTVDPVPSREDLKDTERTEDAKATLRSFVSERLQAIRQDELDACETPFEALQLVSSWNLQGRNRRELTYRGRALPDLVEVEGHRFSGETVHCHVPDPGNWRSRVGTFTQNIQYAVKRQVWIVVGFPNKSVHPAHRQRFLQYTGTTSRYFNDLAFFVKSLRDVKNLEWFDQDRVTVIEWEDLKAVKLPSQLRPERSKNRSATHYTLTFPGERYSNSIEREDLPKGPVFYATLGEIRDYSYEPSRAAQLLEAPVVHLGANQVKKFRRENPRARHALKAVAELGTITAQSLTPIEKGWLYGRLQNEFLELDSADVLDPELKELLKEIENIDHDKIELWKSVGVGASYRFRQDFKLPFDYNLKPTNADIAHLEDLAAKANNRYPLARRAYGAELLEYVNAIYTYRNEA